MPFTRISFKAIHQIANKYVHIYKYINDMCTYTRIFMTIINSFIIDIFRKLFGNKLLCSKNCKNL